MDLTLLQKNLPMLLGSIRQGADSGELVLDQSDAVRRFCFRQGELTYLGSDAGGEQFGGYLLRRGVLDLASLNALLAPGGGHIGEKAVESGLLAQAERNRHLQSLQEQILINALEHPILRCSWTAGAHRDEDQPFHLQSRLSLWRAFQEAGYLAELLPILAAGRDWRWEGRLDLLESLGDLPLSPATAFAISFLATDPISFETFRFLSGFGEEEAGRFIATLWTLGVLVLTEAGRPVRIALPTPEPPRPRPLLTAPEQLPLVPRAPVPAAAFEELAPLDRAAELEFLDLGTIPDEEEPPPPELDWVPQALPEPSPAEFPEPPEPPPPPARTQPLDAQLLLDRARRQVKLGRTLEAVHTLEQAIELAPDEATAYAVWLLLGRLRSANPAWSLRAIDALQNASLLRPKEAEPWAMMGEIYHRRGSRPEAATCFRKALELDPTVALPHDAVLQPEPPPEAPRKGLFGLFHMDRGRKT